MTGTRSVFSVAWDPLTGAPQTLSRHANETRFGVSLQASVWDGRVTSVKVDTVESRVLKGYIYFS